MTQPNDLKSDEFESIAEQYTEIILDGMDWKTMYQYCYDSMIDFHTRDCSGIELKELIDNYDEELFEENILSFIVKSFSELSSEYPESSEELSSFIPSLF